MLCADGAIDINAIIGLNGQCIVNIKFDKRLFLHEDNLCKKVLMQAFIESLPEIEKSALDNIEIEPADLSQSVN